MARAKGYGILMAFVVFSVTSCDGQAATAANDSDRNATATTAKTTTTTAPPAAVESNRKKSDISSHLDVLSELTSLPCEEPDDCKSIESSYCDFEANLCRCKPDFPVTDSKHCYKESKFDEFCLLDIQCQRKDKNSRCNRDFSVCECQMRYVARYYAKGQTHWCVENNVMTDMSVGSYVNPTLFGIMGGLALMFIVMCVVLRLFAKAQFAENRSIFNTPNPRLMNVSLLKDKPGGGRNSHDESTREHRKRSAVGSSGRAASGRQAAAAAAGEAAAAADPEDDQSLIEIKDSAA